MPISSRPAPPRDGRLGERDEVGVGHQVDRDDRRRELHRSIASTASTSLSPRPERPTSHDLARLRLAQRERDGVGRLERRDDPLPDARQVERRERLGVGDGLVGGPAGVLQVGVLGADARVVETGRDGVRLEHLPVGVGQHVGARAVQHRDAPVREGGRVAVLVAAGLGAPERDPGVVEEGVEERRWRWIRRRRRRRRRRAAGPRARGSARAPRGRSPTGGRARASGRGAGPAADPIR